MIIFSKKLKSIENSMEHKNKKHFVRRSRLFLRLTVWFLFLLFVLIEITILRYVARLPVLDARLIYTPSEALTIIKSLDASALVEYKNFNLIDFALIVLYSILLIAWFKLLEPDVRVKIHGWTWFGLIPGFFDLIETGGVAFLLYNTHTEQNPGIWLTVLGTPLKWLSTLIIILLLAFAELNGLRHRVLEGRHWYDLSSTSKIDSV